MVARRDAGERRPPHARYAAFRKAGDVTRAFAAATSVAVGHGSHFGNLAAAQGWIARAERLLDDPEQAPFQGWLLSCAATTPRTSPSRVSCSNAR